MNDWRDIGWSTADGLQALDVEIARRLGLKVNVTTKDKDGNAQFQADQHGNLIYHDAWYVSDDTETWGEIMLIPEYTLDLNLAWSLWNDCEYAVSVTRLPRPSNSFRVNPDIPNSPATWDTSLCLALCRAWLYWQDKQAAK